MSGPAVPPPMSAEMLRGLAARALHWIDWALADADGNAEVAPYNLPVPGSSNDVLTELILARDHLASVLDALGRH